MSAVVGIGARHDDEVSEAGRDLLVAPRTQIRLTGLIWLDPPNRNSLRIRRSATVTRLHDQHATTVSHHVLPPITNTRLVPIQFGSPPDVVLRRVRRSGFLVG